MHYFSSTLHENEIFNMENISYQAEI